MTPWAKEVAAIRREVDTSYAVFRRTPHEALLWVTTVIAVFIATLDDDITDAVRAAVDRYHTERPSVYRQSGRTYRSPRGWTRWTGVIELDLIHPTIARKLSRSKSGLLAEFGIDVTALNDRQRVVVAHEHCVIDHRGHASVELLKRDMRAAWPGVRRVHVGGLHADGTVAENLGRLAAYSTKFSMRYGIAWEGGRTSFLSDFEPEWRTYMRELYQQLGLSRLLNSNIATQAVYAPGAREMHTPRRVSRAKTANSGPLQLSIPGTIEEHCDHVEANRSLNSERTMQPNYRETQDMKVHEVISGYVDPETITADSQRELENAFKRMGPGLTPEEIGIMYGDEEGDLRLEQQRLDVEKTRAEIIRLQAAAMRDQAEAARFSSR